MYTKYNNYIVRKKQEYSKDFDDSKLSKQFIPYFNNDERIEVEFSTREIKRGTVGVTSGWKPCFILLLTTRSTGSSYILSDKDKITTA